MKEVFREIFALDTDDALRFDIDSISVEDITEFKKYHGLHVSAVAFSDEFVRDPLHRTRWNAFLKKKKALVQISLEETISGVKTFAEPLIEETNADVSKWNPESRMWE